jgi:hypothetical protein
VQYLWISQRSVSRELRINVLCNERQPQFIRGHMNRKYKGLMWVSAGMAVYSIIVGHHTGAPSVLIAFAWGWVGVTAAQSKLAEAEKMVVTMIALMVVTCIVLPFTPLWGRNSLAHYSVILVPSLISWVATLVYCDHLRNPPSDETAEWTLGYGPILVSRDPYPPLNAANEQAGSDPLLVEGKSSQRVA